LNTEITFENELNKLIENEDYIESLRVIFLKEINNIKQYKSKIDELLRFSKENNLLRSEAWGYYYLGWYNFDISKSLVGFTSHLIILRFFFAFNISTASLSKSGAMTISTKILAISSAVFASNFLFTAIIPPKIEVESHS